MLRIRRAPVALFLFLAAACSGPAEGPRPDAGGADSNLFDAFSDASLPDDDDGDGTQNDDDCAPGDPDVHPGAVVLASSCAGPGPVPETLIDVDCDGLVDHCACDADSDRYCDGDCEPENAAVRPGATELCNATDDDCDVAVDEGFDEDMDGVRTCAGDCDDSDPTIAMGLPEILDGLDNDCDGVADEPFSDGDGDGVSPVMGDCDDTNADVGPGAYDFGGNGLDDDCDGTVDDPPMSCDAGILSATEPLDFARALGLCGAEVIEARFGGFAGTSGTLGRALPSRFGTGPGALNVPTEGTRMVHLSTGRADTAAHDRGAAYDDTLGGACASAMHPAPLPDPGVCGATDPTTVCDLAEVRLTLRVPANARSFSFQSQFFTSEYPTFRCAEFDDTFVALVTSAGFTGNAIFDATGRPISSSSPLLDLCVSDSGAHDTCGFVRAVPPHACSSAATAPFEGTGYVLDNTPNCTTSVSEGAGATSVLTTVVPVAPGETITLRFVLFDEGDDTLDSSVVLDNLRWSPDPVGAPVTSS